MKVLTSLLLAPVALVHGKINPNRFTKPGSMARASNATAPTCGVGYTYCGYILQQEKRRRLPNTLSIPSSTAGMTDAYTWALPTDFETGAILTAYCSGGGCDSATGTTMTDPLQALYVCLPEKAVPRKHDADDDKPYSGPVKLELLCACSGEPFDGEENVCLNPSGDHIGRCSTPCVNTDCVGKDAAPAGAH